LSLLGEGIYDVAMTIVPMLLIGASVMLERNYFWVFSAATLCGAAAIGLARSQVMTINDAPGADLLMYTVLIGVTAAVARLFTGTLFAVLQRAQDSEQRLKLLNQELDQHVAERTAELQAANHELETFAYTISHDLRTPIRAISGYASILTIEHGDRLEGQELELLQRIDGAARRLSDLNDALLQYARLNSKTLNPQPVHLDELVDNLVKRVKRHHPERAIEWHIDALPTCSGDLMLVRQALQHLIDNAVKFTIGCSPATIEIRCRQEDQQLRLTIRDNGVGFDPQYQDKLFRVFQRLHTQQEFPGEGVGLATVKRIIERHGGEVCAEPGADAGACFHLSLPAAAIA
jgi:signal transduction histidine kinase